MPCFYCSWQERYAYLCWSLKVINKYFTINVENCYTRKCLVSPEQMTHGTFDYYTDLIDPLR